MQPGGAPAPQLALAASATWGPGTKELNAPTLPQGFERLGPIELVAATEESANRVLRSQGSILPAGVNEISSSMRKAFMDQRRRVLRRIGFFDDNHTAARLNRGKMRRRPKGDLSITYLWDENRENEALGEILAESVNTVASRALSSLDAKQTWNTDDPRIQNIVASIGELIVGINETTREAIADVINEGIRRGYSIQQIANGFPEEGYPGIMGVFDDASEARAQVIARTETARFFNLATLTTYVDEGVTRVEVFDGIEYDEDCRKANGEIWTIGRALENPIQHPNCVRAFAAV
jgi:hypothetical protein